MKAASFEFAGRRSYGLPDGSNVFDAGSRLQRRYGDLRDVIAANALNELRNAAGSGVPALDIGDVSLLPVIEAYEDTSSRPVRRTVSGIAAGRWRT